MFWGISPAEDFVKIYEKYRIERNRNDSRASDISETVTCLIIDGQDGRHVLETSAKKYRHKMVKALVIYVTECRMESVARQLLLWQIAHQMAPPSTQNVRHFMEIYGNALVRPLTAKIVTSVTVTLIDLVTCQKPKTDIILPFVDLTALKYRERDTLLRIFTFWISSSAHSSFDLPHIWQMTLRHRLSVRYDAKMGVFDWDLHMRLRPLGANQITNQEYRRFRLDGVAYEWLESEMTYVNRTWASAANNTNNSSDKFLHCTYHLGDMTTGPFCAFGLSCADDLNYTKSTNGTNAFRATDVTERNLRQIFYELRQQREYVDVKRPLELGAAIFKPNDVKVVEINQVTQGKVQKVAPSEGVDGVTVKFVSFDRIRRIDTALTGRFDVIWVSARALPSISGDVLREMSTGLILVENPRFCPEFRVKQLDEMAKATQTLFKENFRFVDDFNVENDNYMTFIKK